jgi:SAM-dependent methyltransferase
MAHQADARRQAALWDRWAASMPQLYPDRDPSAIVDFLDSFGSGSALELGAGDGRVAAPLARRGRPVVALEISEGFIGPLSEHAAAVQGLSLVHGDMAKFDLGCAFEIIYSVRSTFFQLGSQTRQVDCLACIARHLAPGGVVVLDCFVPDLDLLRAGQSVQLKATDDDSVDIRACEVDVVAQTMTYREISLRDGALPRVLPVEQRYCWPSELDALARVAGLQLARRDADFEGTAFTARSRRHVSIYRATADHVSTVASAAADQLSQA